MAISIWFVGCVSATTIITDTSVNSTDLNLDGNLTLGEKITFTLGEIIDNIVDGWVRVIGGLNVTGDIKLAGAFYDSNSEVGTSGQIFSTTASGVDWINDYEFGEPFTIVAMGQSNMVGADDTGGDMETDTRIKMWSGSVWVLADLSIAPFNGNNNIAFHFAKKIAEEKNCEVRIILEAKGGRPISDWVPSNATRYTSMQTKIANSGTTKVDAILWHQGESDNSRTNIAYATDLQSLVTQLRSESSISSTTPIVVGELLQNVAYDNQNGVFENLHNYISDPYVVVARAKFLSDKGDNLHFSGSSLVTLGRIRYFAAFENIPRYEKKILIDRDNDTKIQVEENEDEDSIRFDVAGNEAVVIDSSGNIGIGTTTPQRELHVNGDILSNATINATTDVCIEGGNCLSGMSVGSGTITGTGTLNYIPMWNSTTSLKNSEIYMNGSNVGICTTTPAYKLHVNSNNVNQVGIFESTDPYALVIFKDDTTTGNSKVSVGAFGDELLMFSSGAERMRVDNSGNVGIGTTAPNSTLSVNGIMQTIPRSTATCDSDAEGGIYYDSDDNHFYGCNSTDWLQLDN